jgi:hypothetical protein
LVELTNDQFDEIEIRELSCFGVVPMRPVCRPHRLALIPVQTHTEHTSPKSTLVELRSICYCGSAMVVTHSCIRNGHPVAERCRSYLQHSKLRLQMASVADRRRDPNGPTKLQIESRFRDVAIGNRQQAAHGSLLSEARWLATALAETDPAAFPQLFRI